MSQRYSGYKREGLDLYTTPSWVVDALMPHLPRRLHVWEPCCGAGAMVRALVAAGHVVNASDIANGGVDFLKIDTAPHGVAGIITNPPYATSRHFVEHAIELMEPVDGFVAMLLRIDYGSASTRQHLFGACRIFSRKIELTKRIRWFEGTTGNPSFNHAWFVWDWHHRGRPELLYAPPVALPVAHASRPGQERNCRRDDCDHGRRGGRENSESGTNCGYHE